MSTPQVRRKRPLKPPACDSCKARRVLCHPQPVGKPCPRCFEKNIACTTTPVVRGRPRKNIESSSSTPAIQELLAPESAVPEVLSEAVSPSVILLSQNHVPDCPDLTPELVAHFFECFDHLPPVTNPVIVATSIKTSIRDVSFQLSLLPPQSRALARCIIAFASLVSFHPAVLGPGPVPKSFVDPNFFASQAEVRKCGARRAAVCRTLHAAALREAWDVGIMLQVSNENAASCFLLELIEQCTSSPGLSRPWASAYISHVRALAPIWRTSPTYNNPWAGFLMSEALISTRARKPILITYEDQLLLCGPEPPSQEEFLASLELAASNNKSSLEILVQSMKPFMLHITILARQLWATITGDHLQSAPPSESAVLKFLSALSLNHAIASHLLAHAEAVLAASASVVDPSERSLVVDRTATQGTIVRGCAYGIVAGFTGLALPLYCELGRRLNAGAESQSQNEVANSNPNPASYARTRIHLLLEQARQMTSLATREFARATRILGVVHLVPVQRRTVCDYAKFALDELEGMVAVDPERVRNLQTISNQLSMAGYSQDLFSNGEMTRLIQRLDQYLDNVAQSTTSTEFNFDSDLTAMFGDLLLPLDQAWMGSLMGILGT